MLNVLFLLLLLWFLIKYSVLIMNVSFLCEELHTKYLFSVFYYLFEESSTESQNSPYISPPPIFPFSPVTKFLPYFYFS